jgi:hypothetical protein
MQLQKRIKQLCVPLLAAVILSACNSDNNDTAVPPSPPPVEKTAVKIIHAVSDAPNVKIDGGPAIQVNGLPFAQSTAKYSIPAGATTVAVDALLPGNATARVIGPATLNLLPTQTYAVFAVGLAANSSIEALVVNQPATAVTSGNARVQIVHAAASAPMVDIHVTAPDATLSSSTVTGTLSFKQFSAALSVPAADYRIRITLPGQHATVVFDSGRISLVSGNDLTVAAINNRFAGAAPVSLLAVDANGMVSEIKDSKSTADVRVVHAVSDAPAVDVLLNNSKAIAGLKFPEFTNYAKLTPGAYNVKVAAAADNAVVVINADLTLTAGNFYTVLATGSLGGNTITPLVLADSPRRIATAAQIRLVHGSTLAGNVDIYVTANSDISAASPAFSNVAFKAETGYVPLTPGSYVVTVTPTGTKTAAIGPLRLELAGNKIYTAVARDGVGRSAPLGLIVLDDFNQ